MKKDFLKRFFEQALSLPSNLSIFLTVQDVMGVENPISDELMKAGERPTPLTNGGAHHTAPMSAKEMYETEGWPADRHRYPNGHGRRLPDEEDTKL